MKQPAIFSRGDPSYLVSASTSASVNPIALTTSKVIVHLDTASYRASQYCRLTRRRASVLFPAWETFYVIVGSAAGALTGLMFVVIALVANARTASEPQLDAFGTPTVVHFGAALLLSVLLAAPWPGPLSMRISLALYGGTGLAYMIEVVRRTRRVTGYQPVFEDWLFHAVLPLASYVAVFIAALGLRRASTLSLFAIGAAAVLLLFVGVHNAWDTVTYILVSRWEARRGRPGGARDDAVEERPL
jgi:hypothetical protein